MMIMMIMMIRIIIIYLVYNEEISIYCIIILELYFLFCTFYIK